VILPMIQMFNQAKNMNIFGSRNPNLEKKHENEMKFISKSIKLVKDFENDQTEKFNEELDIYTALVLFEENDFSDEGNDGDEEDFNEDGDESEENEGNSKLFNIIPQTPLVKLEKNQRICASCHKVTTFWVNFEGSVKNQPMRVCPACNEILKK
jgi:hypothetical protein